MSASIPESYLDLFQKKAFGSLSTLMPDGSPQTNPVWVDYQNGEVWVNSAVGPSERQEHEARSPRIGRRDRSRQSVPLRGSARQGTRDYPGRRARSTSTRWPRSIWTRTSIRSRNPASSACSTRSSPSTSIPWDSRELSSSQEADALVLSASMRTKLGTQWRQCSRKSAVGAAQLSQHGAAGGMLGKATK